MQILISKKNYNHIMELGKYKYEIREKKGSPLQKIKFSFICKYKGNCNKSFDRSWNLLDH